MPYKICLDDTAFCLHCGDPILYGRPDKKFCSDICRHRYHNGNARRTRAFMSKVRNILMRNHQILSNLLRVKIERISMKDLVDMGYDPRYVTYVTLMEKHGEFMCYDIRFRQTDKALSHLRKESLRRRSSPEKNVSLSSETDE